MEQIDRAAILLPDGTVHSLPRPARHSDLIRDLIEKRHNAPITGVQGFVTSENRFVDRVEAASIALATNQITKLLGNRLHSEDLW